MYALSNIASKVRNKTFNRIKGENGKSKTTKT